MRELFRRSFIAGRIAFSARQMIVVLCAGIIGALPAHAQEIRDIPFGMELRRVNDVDLVLPQGVRVSERDGLIIIEPLETYVARRLQQMKVSLQELQQRIEKLEIRLQASDATLPAEPL